MYNGENAMLIGAEQAWEDLNRTCPWDEGEEDELLLDYAYDMNLCGKIVGDAIEAVHTNQIDMLATNSPKAAFSRKLADLTSMDYTTLGYEMLISACARR